MTNGIDISFAMAAGKLPLAKTELKTRNEQVLRRTLKELKNTTALFTPFGWHEVFTNHMNVRDVEAVFGQEAATFVSLYRQGIIRRGK
jgi:hypothetical protein